VPPWDDPAAGRAFRRRGRESAITRQMLAPSRTRTITRTRKLMSCSTRHRFGKLSFRFLQIADWTEYDALKVLRIRRVPFCIVNPEARCVFHDDTGRLLVKLGVIAGKQRCSSASHSQSMRPRWRSSKPKCRGWSPPWRPFQPLSARVSLRPWSGFQFRRTASGACRERQPA